MPKTLFTTALSTAAFAFAFAFTPLHAGEALKEGTARITLDGKTFDGKISSNDSDYVAMGVIENITIAFRPAKESPVSLVIVSLGLENGALKGDSGEVVAMLKGKGYLISPNKGDAVTLKLAKTEKRGTKRYVEGTATAKVYFTPSMTKRSTNEADAKEITVEFAAEAAPL